MDSYEMRGVLWIKEVELVELDERTKRVAWFGRARVGVGWEMGMKENRGWKKGIEHGGIYGSTVLSSGLQLWQLLLLEMFLTPDFVYCRIWRRKSIRKIMKFLAEVQYTKETTTHVGNV